MTQRADLIGGRELVQVRNENPSLGNLIRRVIAAVERMAQNTGVSAVGQAAPPPTVGAVQVKAAGGIAHVTVSDSAQVSKPVEYFIEHDTDPNFPAPHVVHLVSSRGAFLNLPAKNDAGASQNWYFRAYSQYPGSQPSKPVYFGGLSPTAVSVGGAVQLTPLSSTGSGTASPLGGQGGWGRGKVPTRPAPAPKRSVTG
jgi:hypothetical protein